MCSASVPRKKMRTAPALDYEQTLRKFFGLQPGEFPRFDLALLGLGPDGHTASLFPGTTALNEKSRLVVANWVDKFQSYRITVTLPVLNRAACVMFLASGADKANIVQKYWRTRMPTCHRKKCARRMADCCGYLIARQPPVFLEAGTASDAIPPGAPVYPLAVQNLENKRI